MTRRGTNHRRRNASTTRRARRGAPPARRARRRRRRRASERRAPTASASRRVSKCRHKASRMPSLGVPAWRVAIRAALKKNGKSACAKFAQLATVRASTGAPAVRTVVFRGFGDAFRDDDDDAKARRRRTARDEARGHGDERAVRIRGVLRDKNRAQEVVRAVRAVLGDDAALVQDARGEDFARDAARTVDSTVPADRVSEESERFRRRGDEDEGGEKRDARRVVG